MRRLARLIVVLTACASILACTPEEREAFDRLSPDQQQWVIEDLKFQEASAESEPEQPPPPPPPPSNPCDEYDALEAGTGTPGRQHWFNHLDAPGYAQFRGACRYGIGTAEWNCLYQKIDEESGWYHLADGPNGPAGNTWGIPQAYPGEKMRSHGPDWKTNPRVQVRWMLDYIEERYNGSLFNDSNPCHAGY